MSRPSPGLRPPSPRSRGARGNNVMSSPSPRSRGEGARRADEGRVTGIRADADGSFPRERSAAIDFAELIRKHRIALLAAAAFHFVFFFPTLFMGRVVSPNDVFYNFDPWLLLPHAPVQNSLMNDPPTSLLPQLALLRHGGAFHWD